MEVLYEPSPTGVFAAQAIEELEASVGSKLPDDYKDFVTKLGGVRFPSPRVTYDVEWRRVDAKALESDEDEDFEDDFMLLVLSDPENIHEHIRYLHAKDGTYEPFLPKTFFPFAKGATGDYLVMSLAENDYGAVYVYFPSDDPWGTGENNYLGYIASSFTDFIENKIRPYE